MAQGKKECIVMNVMMVSIFVNTSNVFFLSRRYQSLVLKMENLAADDLVVVYYLVRTIVANYHAIL